MHFFERNFTKHHLLHAPHKWFLAFLASPIHFLESHYKKRYHLRFVHARKLFIFDMFLLAGIIALLSLTITWFLYNPTVADQIELTIKENNELQQNYPDSPRVKSGELIVYDINFKNNSRSTLAKTSLKIKLPVGFSPTKIVSRYTYNEINNSFQLPNLDSGDKGGVQIKGWLYGVPHKEEYILAELAYKQKGRDVEEVKTTALVSILRGSVLTGFLEMPNKIINNQAQKATITLQNNGKLPLTGIKIPLNNPNTNIAFLTATKGALKNNNWEIDIMKPGQNASMTLNLFPSLGDSEQDFTFALTPSVNFNNEEIPQETISKNLKLAHPGIKITNSWQNNQDAASPGDVLTLYTTLTNSGDSELKNVSLIIPVPANIIDSKKITALNKGHYAKGVGVKTGAIGSAFIIKHTERADLSELKPWHSVTVPIQIPILAYINSGTDISLSLQPWVEATLSDIPDAKVEFQNNSPALKIGTVLSVSAEARYYTEDGDQLGRGPLPPQVGSETKYGIILRVNNSTSAIEKINLTATLPQYARWTDKTSVGKGNDIKFNSSNNTIQWSLDSLTAHDSVLLFFEVGLTPTETQRGTNPILLQNIQATGFDSFIWKNLKSSAPPISSALISDSRAKTKGVVAQ